MYRGEEILKKAREDAMRGCYSKSFDEYIAILEKNPDIKFGIESEFREVLERFNKHLLKKDNSMQEIFFNFERACRAYPDDADIITDFGRYMYLFNYFIDSCRHFQKALEINMGLVTPEKYLNCSKAKIIPRRHFRLLNDKIKNDTYYNGIMQTVIPHTDKILDMCAGTGLLSLYAMERDPQEIVATENSYYLADFSRTIFKEYRYDVTVVQKLIIEVKAEEMNGLSSLLLTELFDAAVIGEHVLTLLQHAWLSLLQPNARVLPQKAILYVAAARCDELSAKYRVQCADMLNMLGIPGENVHVSLPDKTYDTDDLVLYENIKYVAEPAVLITFDFNNLPDIKKKRYNMERYKVNLEASMYEEVNVVIGWFDLQIADGITLSTDPRSERCVTAWGQPVFHDFIPRSVKSGDTIDLQFSIFRNKVTLLQNTNVITRVSQDMIRFLNDIEFTKIIKTCIPSIFIYLSELCVFDELNIMDMNPFPLLGFILMKRGAKYLTCYATTPEDKKFIKEIFKKNKIPLERIQILTSERLNESLLKPDMYHMIANNLLQLNGDLNTSLKLFLDKVKRNRFVHDGLLYPKKVTIQGQLIRSHWIDNNHVVNSDNTRYNVGKGINVSQVSQVFNVDVAHLKYQPMSNQYELGVCSDPMDSRLFRMQVTRSGDVSGLLCWYNVHLDDKEFSTRRSFSYVDSIVFRIAPPISMLENQYVSVTRCVDIDQNFKFIVDND